MVLVERVQERMPDVRVIAGFVELFEPTIDAALSTVLSEGATSAVVVPLMVGVGGHVREDIPEAIEAGRKTNEAATVVCTRHLGAPAPMVSAVRQRIEAAGAGWSAEEITVVFVGRGTSLTEANADHVRLGRVLHEAGGYANVLPAFIQIAGPTVAEALDLAYGVGNRKIVVMPHYLFTGRLDVWVHRACEEWSADHPEADVRVADPIGACPELVDVIVARYREGMLKARTNLGSPAYLSGLLLSGRKAVAVGGGCVNRRRVPKLVAAGAEVTVVAPSLHPALAELVRDGSVTWREGSFDESDLDGAWYVLAATDDPATNARIAAAAEARHTFCVRADRAELGSAWTPATADVEGATIAVLADQNPRRSRELRDRMVELLEADDDPV